MESGNPKQSTEARNGNIAEAFQKKIVDDLAGNRKKQVGDGVADGIQDKTPSNIVAGKESITPPGEPHLFLNDETNENLKVEVLKEFDIQRKEWKFNCKFSEDRSNLDKIKYTAEVTYKDKSDYLVLSKLPTKRRWMVYYLRECIDIFMEKDK
jgi:hypothetical protein